MNFRTLAIAVAAMLSTAAVSADEVQCPPGADEVDARVVPRVDYDSGRQLYTYRYTLENLRFGRLPVINLDLEVPRDKVSGVASPEGWFGKAQGIGPPGGEQYAFHWFAYRVENPDRISDDPSIPRSVSALEPGESLDGFVVESPLPPGPKMAYVTGEVRHEPASEAEMERLYAECETVGRTYLEAARKVRTAGPAEGDFRPIRIDIMPGSAENPVNPGKQGVVPVAVLGGSDLAVSQIDRASLRFGPEDAEPAHRNHESRDIDGDGLLDLLVHFDVAETGLACLDSVAFVQGETVEGDKVQGFDTLTTPGCRGRGQSGDSPD